MEFAEKQSSISQDMHGSIESMLDSAKEYFKLAESNAVSNAMKQATEDMESLLVKLNGSSQYSS